MHSKQEESNNQAKSLNQEVVCQSCGNTFSGDYCTQCGEKVVDRQAYTFGYFLKQIVEGIMFWDSKFIKTVRLLFTKPGFLPKEYLQGKRKLYTKPIQLFFIINLIYFLFEPVDTFNTHYNSQIKGQIYSGITYKMAKEKAEKNGVTIDSLELEYDTKSGKNAKLFLVLWVVLFSGLLMVLYYRDGYFYEHLILSFSILSGIILGLFILIPYIIMALLYSVYFLTDYKIPFDPNSGSVTVFIIAAIIVYLYFALQNFYTQKKWVTLAKASILSIHIVLSAFAYRFILFYITLSML